MLLPSFLLLRVIVGVFCVAFAHLAGRSIIRLQQGRERQSRTIAWGLRTIITGAAASWRSWFDMTTVVVWGLAMAALAAGLYDEWRPKREEELERAMFPKE